MRKENTVQLGVIIVLTIAVLVMAVGYAAFSQSLTINGTVTASAAKWSVRLKGTSYAESTGSVAATTKTITDTAMTYAATLDKPGDFYEFTVDVENNGTFDAKLTSINLSALDATQSKYIKYTVSYGSTDYTATATGLNVALAASATETVKVRVEYYQPEDSNDLPTTAATVNLTCSLGYQQAE